ncbi:DUF202 domain-containing protein [Larkinella insperata]|uniref:DUF202 domain-containing protein n=1 Tax=Larkinella insperata TaxID=332158 RepID=A0ABW3QKG9_9BACT|nr:DUF202 domain-containing protein [Larkinella insperata]
MKSSELSPKTTLTLTEILAADRTRLANERTLLAYVRTALALIISGTGFSQYLETPWLRTVFIVFIPTGVLILLLGLLRFWQRRKVLDRYSETGRPPVS